MHIIWRAQKAVSTRPAGGIDLHRRRALATTRNGRIPWIRAGETARGRPTEKAAYWVWNTLPSVEPARGDGAPGEPSRRSGDCRARAPTRSATVSPDRGGHGEGPRASCASGPKMAHSRETSCGAAGMTTSLVRAAMAVIRLWGRFYTQGLPPHVRKRRRDEITSDVWDHVSEGEEYPMSLAAQLFWRLVIGLGDDVAWSLEQRRAGWFWRRTLAAGALVALAVVVTRSAVTRLPPPPPPPTFTVHAAPNPPPPPPPLDRRGGSVPLEFTYGETSYTVIPQAAAPDRLKEVRPIYPPLLRAASVEGVVVVSGRITENGRVADAHLVQPAGLLGQSAINAVRQWEFAPSKSTDHRSDRVLTVSVKFSSSR